MSKIYFNHIPKTAGTTFFDILKKQYSKDELYSINIKDYKKSFEDFRMMDQAQGEKIKCVSGHLSVFLQPKEEVKTISFLRNPIDRTLSSFYYIKRAHWNKDYERVKNLSSITDFIEYRTAQNLDNQQTRYMAQDFDYLINDAYPSAPVDEAMYRCALENLKRYKYTFITEQFDDALIYLYENLKWKKIPFYKVHNKTKDRRRIDSLTSEEIDLVKAFCHYDLKLYEEAKKVQENLLKTVKNQKLKLYLFRWFNKFSIW